jgi:hypothetical protein
LGRTPLRSRGTTPPRDKSASLEGHTTLEWDSASLKGWTSPPRVRPRLDQEPNAPSSEFPSRSRVSRAAAPIPAPPAGAFNALTPVGVQVKGESTPLHAWESCPATAPPTPCHCATLCGMVSNRPAALYHPLPYGQRTAPSKKDGRTLEGMTCNYSTPARDGAVTSGQWERSPPSPSALCDHPRHHGAVPATASPYPTLWNMRRQDTATPATMPRMASRQQHPRAGPRAAARRAPSTPPPSKPFLYGHRTRHGTPPEAGFARTTVYSMTLHSMPLHAGKIVWHACKLLPPWPIKEGAVPQPRGDDGQRSLTRFPPSPRYWHLPQSVPLGPGGLTSSPASLVNPLYKHYGATQYSAPSTPLLDVRPPAGTRIKISVTSCLALAIRR